MITPEHGKGHDPIPSKLMLFRPADWYTDAEWPDPFTADPAEWLDDHILERRWRQARHQYASEHTGRCDQWLMP
jgi:hypothetical protein